MTKLKQILLPFGTVPKKTRTLIFFSWIALIILMWFIGASSDKHIFPTPYDVFDGFKELYAQGLVTHIFSSLALCFISIFFAILISALLAYSWPIALLKPIGTMITKFRFLPFTGLTFFLTMMVNDARQMQIWILVIFLTTFLTTSMIGVVKDIPQEEFDHAKSLKCSRWEVLWQVVILGRLDYLFESIRQNLAIAWMMLVTVEAIVAANGGLGLLIKNSDKFMNHGRIVALQLIILLIGLSLDFFINFLRKALFRYSRI